MGRKTLTPDVRNLIYTNPGIKLSLGLEGSQSLHLLAQLKGFLQLVTWQDFTWIQSRLVYPEVKRVMGAITTARLKAKGTMYSRKLRREDKSWSLKFLNEAKAKQLWF